MNARDLTASAGRVAGLIMALPVSVARSRRGQGLGHGEGLGYWGKARVHSGRHSGLNHRHDTGARAPEGVDRGRAAQRRRGLAPASNCAKDRATYREIRAWGVTHIEWRLWST
jgi:hypothetical protein